MFCGEYHNLLDDKGRLSIPAKLREQIAEVSQPGPLVITLGLDECLWVYPNDTWKRNEEQLARLSLFDKKMRSFVRAFTACKSRSEIDKQGRVVVPPFLRETAKLDREVVLVGALNHIEVWDRERWREARTTAAQSLQSIAQDLADRGVMPELTL
jgi:MraZ protein